MDMFTVDFSVGTGALMPAHPAVVLAEARRRAAGGVMAAPRRNDGLDGLFQGFAPDRLLFALMRHHANLPEAAECMRRIRRIAAARLAAGEGGPAPVAAEMAGGGESEATDNAAAEARAQRGRRVACANWQPDGRRILSEVARDFGLKLADLRGACRDTRHVTARQAAAWRLRTETEMSYTAMGRVMSVDHTSVIYMVAMYAQRNGLTAPDQCTRNMAEREPTGRAAFEVPLVPVLEGIAKRYGVSLMDMRSLRRDARAALARHEAMYVLAAEHGATVAQLCGMFAGRLPESIRDGIRAHAERCGLELPKAAGKLVTVVADPDGPTRAKASMAQRRTAELTPEVRAAAELRLAALARLRGVSLEDLIARAWRQEQTWRDMQCEAAWILHREMGLICRHVGAVMGGRGESSIRKMWRRWDEIRGAEG